MNMNKNIVFLLLFLSFAAAAAMAENSVQGLVVDENNNPVQGVVWKISAIEEMLDGRWTLVHYSGVPVENMTDKDGIFIIRFDKIKRYDLQFYKAGFAPTFLYQVPSNSPELKVVLKRGESIHGTVSRIDFGSLVPVKKEMITLRLPTRDFWYQEKIFTDANGSYGFRVSAPQVEPDGIKHKWQVVVADKAVEVDVQDGRPVDELNFEINVIVKKIKQ